MFSMIASAAEGPHVDAAYSFLDRLETAIIYPLITLMMAVAFLVFVDGIQRFVEGANDETQRAKGKRNMGIGLAGLLVMLSAFSILKLVTSTFGIDVPTQP